MAKWVTVKFKCSCMKEEGEFFVRPRGPTEDLMEWMGVMTDALGKAHHERSPLCNASVTEYVKLPLDGQYIGDPGGGTA